MELKFPVELKYWCIENTVTQGNGYDSNQFGLLLGWSNRVLQQKEIILTYDKTYDSPVR